jgi:hypothetical protein
MSVFPFNPRKVRGAVRQREGLSHPLCVLGWSRLRFTHNEKVARQFQGLAL